VAVYSNGTESLKVLETSTENSGANGGAVYLEETNSELKTVFRENEARVYGGVIYTKTSEISVSEYADPDFSPKAWSFLSLRRFQSRVSPSNSTASLSPDL